MPAKPLRMALGSLLIQKQYGYADEELVEQIREGVGETRLNEIMAVIEIHLAKTSK